jgi:hypothetical protein
VSSQRGQAIVGVLVVMTLVFLLAGAVTFAASAVLAAESRPQGAVTDDLMVQSAVAGGAAHVAGGGSCNTQTPPAGAAGGIVDLSPPSFQVPMPADPHSKSSAQRSAGAFCLAVAKAASRAVRLPLTWTAGSVTCAITPLPADYAKGRVWILFGTTAWSQSSVAYVADGQPPAVCQAASSPSGSSSRCQPATPQSPQLSRPMALAALYCDLTGAAGTPYLYVRNGPQMPQVAYLAHRDDVNGGTTTLVEASTLLSGPRRYEEALVFSRGSSRAQILSEGVLP